MLLTTKHYLLKLCNESQARSTEYYSAEVEEFAILLGKIVQTLQNFHLQNQKTSENPKHIAFGLMTKGANTLMAGFELALTGYHYEPAALYRTALEGFATAWDVVHNPQRLEIWKSGKKFDSTYSISNVKEVVEPIGKLWGFLSSMNIHTGPINSSPAMFPGVGDEEPKFQFFGFIPEGKEGFRKSEIYFSLFLAFICLQLTELVFFRYSLELETVERIPNTDTVKNKVSERHKPFVEKMTKQFLKMSNGEF